MGKVGKTIFRGTGIRINYNENGLCFPNIDDLFLCAGMEITVIDKDHFIDTIYNDLFRAEPECACKRIAYENDCKLIKARESLKKYIILDLMCKLTYSNSDDQKIKCMDLSQLLLSSLYDTHYEIEDVQSIIKNAFN